MLATSNAQARVPGTPKLACIWGARFRGSIIPVFRNYQTIPQVRSPSWHGRSSHRGAVSFNVVPAQNSKCPGAEELRAQILKILRSNCHRYSKPDIISCDQAGVSLMLDEEPSSNVDVCMIE
ncbi:MULTISPECIES: hypothetical protein [unclassified Microcoleus]|uniref:hypothetical protein n=1 Tax=unclassified Microcoleus TaxID=2642155 RepID=UPI002FD068DA